MKSTTSSSNKISAVFKNLFKRNMYISIAQTIVCALFTIGALQVVSRDIKNSFIPNPEPSITEYVMSILIFTQVISMITVFITIAMSFREMFTKRGADFFFSLPVKRETYVNAVYLTTALNALITYVVPAVFVAVFKMFNENVIIDYKRLIIYSAVMILIILSEISILLFCASISGKISHYIMFCVITVWAGFLFVSVAYCFNYIWGFWNDIAYAGAILSPAGAVILMLKSMGNAAVYVAIISVIEAVLFFVLANILFKKRKSEIAETTVSGIVIPLALLVLLQAAIVMVITLIGYDDLKVTAIISIVFALLGTLGLGFQWFGKKNVRLAFISLAVVVTVCCSLIFAVKNISFDKYVSYVPEASKVEKIELYEFVDYGMDGVLMQYVQDNSSRINNSKDADYTFNTPESIEKIINLHKKVASNEFKKNAVYNNGKWDVKIVYTLKDGKTVTRCYSLPSKQIVNEHHNFMQTEEAIRQNEPFTINDKDILCVSYDNYGESTKFYKLDSYNDLKDILVKDYINESSDDFEYRMQMWASSFYYFADINYADMEQLTEYDEDEWFNAESGRIIFYWLAEDTPEKEREMFFEMTPEQVDDYYMNKNFDYGNYINSVDFNVYKSDVNTINFLNNAKTAG